MLSTSFAESVFKLIRIYVTFHLSCFNSRRGAVTGNHLLLQLSPDAAWCLKDILMHNRKLIEQHRSRGVLTDPMWVCS